MFRNMTMASIRRAVACATLASGLCAASASASFSTATVVPCGSSEGFGSFRAELIYWYGGGSSANVSITLTNDTEVSLGGLITALAINPNATVGGVSVGLTTLPAFEAIAVPISAPPYGSFAAGVGLGGSFLGSGDPSSGIGVGGFGIFNFTLTGSAEALAALTAETVLSQDSGYSMVVRFRGGAVDDWSDKVVGCALPAPGALALLGASGLVPRRRRRV